MIRILVDSEDDRAVVLAAMDRGALADLLLRPFVVAWDHASLLPDAAGEDPLPSPAEGKGDYANTFDNRPSLDPGLLRCWPA